MANEDLGLAELFLPEKFAKVCRFIGSLIICGMGAFVLSVWVLFIFRVI